MQWQNFSIVWLLSNAFRYMLRKLPVFAFFHSCQVRASSSVWHLIAVSPSESFSLKHQLICSILQPFLFFFFLHYSYLPFDLHACATLAHWHWTQPSLPSSLPMLLAQYDKNCCLCVHGGHLAAITTLLFSIISHIHIYKIIIRALGCLNFKTNFNKHNHHNKNQFQVVLN